MTSLNQRISVFEQDKVIFKATTDLETNITFNTGNVAPFNKIAFCYPNTSDFNTSTYKYTVPRNGIYQFTFQLFQSSTPSTSTKFGFYKNNAAVAVAGAYVSNSEALTFLENCVVGDTIDVRCYLTSSSVIVFMSEIRCWFTGILVK